MTGIARSLFPFPARRPCSSWCTTPSRSFPSCWSRHSRHPQQCCWSPGTPLFPGTLDAALLPGLCKSAACVHGQAWTRNGWHTAHCHACKLPHAALLAVLQLVLLHVAGATAHDMPGAPACAAPGHPAVAAAAAAFLHRRAAGAQAPQRSTSWFLPLRVGCLQVQRREAASAWL